MIIEVGQVWKKPIKKIVLVYIKEVSGRVATISVAGQLSTLHVAILIDSLQSNRYFLCTDLTMALM